MKAMLFILLLPSALAVEKKDLFEQRIRALRGRKTAVYLTSGIFHNGAIKRNAALKKMRHSFSPPEKTERIVFEFYNEKLPKIYGQIDGKNKRVRISFFKTKITDLLQSLGNSRYVEKIDFLPLTNGILASDITFKKTTSIEIFYLESPARLVLDVKI